MRTLALRKDEVRPDVPELILIPPHAVLSLAAHWLDGVSLFVVTFCDQRCCCIFYRGGFISFCKEVVSLVDDGSVSLRFFRAQCELVWEAPSSPP